jgi:extracellular elastinolytic metalloproteinase
VDEILSVTDSELYNHVILFPNPTQGIMTIVNRTTTQLLSAVITDVNGRIIRTLDLSSSGMTTEFSVEALATGLYFVEISTDTTRIVKRIVKQ